METIEIDLNDFENKTWIRSVRKDPKEGLKDDKNENSNSAIIDSEGTNKNDKEHTTNQEVS